MIVSLNFAPMTQNVLFPILKTKWKSFLSLVFEALMVSPTTGPAPLEFIKHLSQLSGSSFFWMQPDLDPGRFHLKQVAAMHEPFHAYLPGTQDSC